MLNELSTLVLTFHDLLIVYWSFSHDLTLKHSDVVQFMMFLSAYCVMFNTEFVFYCREVRRKHLTRAIIITII